MAHFAKLNENNIVIQVNVVDNNDILNLPFPASEAVGIQFLITWSGGYTNWKQTSYNDNFRRRYARIGDTYDSQRDAFIPPKPYASWVLNETTCEWEAPVPYPVDQQNRLYNWNEETQSWILWQPPT